MGNDAFGHAQGHLHVHVVEHSDPPTHTGIGRSPP